MSSRIRTYDITETLGEGGMGTVFRARHRATDQEVALKVLRQQRHSDDELRALWKAEIRATARLSHPNIVTVLDVGTVDRPVEVAGHRIEEGQDFLVVELIEGGALDRLERLDWIDVKQVLIHVLSGLGHAHACGVIHRDIKPANILFDRLPSGHLLPKIADFGLAHLDPEETIREDGRFAGTPAFMAPEQITGHIRDHGPWTDLYAVGCMAYALVAGRPPFVGEHYLDVLRQHTEGDVPPLPEDARVPGGFDSWIARLLARQPRQRFLHAADAAHGLLTLGDPPGGEARSGESQAPVGLASTIAMPTTIAMATLPLSGGVSPLPRDTAPQRAARMPIRPPPMPPSWRADEDREPLQRTGVALFGVRPSPLLERRDEQELLWDELRKVRQTQTPRCVIVRGEPGSGKTRLGEWLLLHADEPGVANVIRTAHEPFPTQFHGVSGMLRRYFRLGGMDEREARGRVRSWLQELGAGDAADETEKLVEWVSRQPDRGERQMVDRELLDIGHRLFELATRQRPVLLFADDVQWGRNAMTFVLELLHRGDLPVLAVCTVGPAKGADEPDLASDLIEFAARREESTVLELEPPSRSAQRDLLTDHYGLKFEVAVRLLDRSGGNPVFTENLLRDVIERQVLVPTRDGWQLDPAADVSLPADVSALMIERAERFAQNFDDEEAALRGLESAAVLGREFDAVRWRSVCAHAGIRPPPALLREGVAAGLLARTEPGWTFQDERLHEAIVQHAARRGRLAELHEACASALEPVLHTDEFALLPRYARHLARASRTDRALRALLDAARLMLVTGDGRAALRLLHLFRDTASTVELAVDAPIVVEALTLYGRIALMQMEMRPRLEPMLQAALESAKRARDPRWIAEALASLSFWELCEGSSSAALKFAHETTRFIRSTDDPLHEFSVLVLVAVTFSCVGEAEEGNRLLEDIFGRIGSLDPAVRIYIAANAAEVALYGGLEEELMRWVDRAESLADPTHPVSRGATSLLRAYTADVRDDHPDLLRHAAAVEREAAYSQSNRKLVARWMSTLSRVRHEPSTVAPEELSEFTQVLSPRLYEHARTRIAQCLLSLHRGEPEEARSQLELAGPGLATGKVIFFLARDAEYASHAARTLGFDDLAVALAEIAAQQWRGLGRPDRAASIERAFELPLEEREPGD